MPNRKRILVVDDERPNRELLEAILTGLGHDVDMAADGMEALAKLDSSHDLILLDVMMSGIDGFEVTRRIRGGSPFFDIPICMVTALSGREQRLLAVEAGANDFIGKPIDKTELRVRVNSLLRTKEAQDTVKACNLRMETQNHILSESRDQLEQASQLKDEFIRIASHDLKNPLTCILGFATLLEYGIKPGQQMTAEAHETIGRIIAQARTMEKIVCDFLDFHVLQDGHMKVALAPIDLNEMVRAAILQNSGNARAKGIELSEQLAENPPFASGDVFQIGQVLDNLVGNAIKFGNRGDATCVRTLQDGNYIVVEVTDSGPGLAEEDVLKLFVKYARLSNKPTGGEKSSGLGLAICRKLIELNGGQIGGRNNDDRGATFWFKLPVA